MSNVIDTTLMGPMNERATVPIKERSIINSIDSRSTKPASQMYGQNMPNSEMNSVHQSLSSQNILGSLATSNYQQKMLDAVYVKSALNTNQAPNTSLRFSSISLA